VVTPRNAGMIFCSRKTPFFLFDEVLKIAFDNFTELKELFTTLSELSYLAEDKSALNCQDGQERSIEVRSNIE
jgi:hypothetical protein